MMSNSETIKVAPFTWRREDSGTCEAWTLVVPEDASTTSFCLKNYGNDGGMDAFSGWRLVSGGPFTRAGKWASRDEAMVGVVPFLRDYLLKDVSAKLAHAQLKAKAMKELLKNLEGE